ncbi:MAG TPA: 2-C-methyl-D-erythritol 4-phosphate cytidylyltransferase [Vicinamibacterales bacterium]|nr:2-C-methyl-D-erythritol 4-phosphate cytidylyltransferase [Vicinamibacterales bacterium]
MRTGVIVVAGGQGLRMGGSVPKQLLEIGGRSVLQRSLHTFDSHPDVSQIVVVLHESLLAGSAELVGPLTRPHVVVAGGRRRQDSVANGMAAIQSDCDVVLVHDAARPFVSRTLIDRVIAGAAEHGAVIPALGVRDTVKRAGATRQVMATIPRDEVWLAQTPQGFQRSVLADAVRRGAGGADVTDEGMLAEQAGYPVKIVNGEPENLKITTPEDLAAARARAQPRTATRVGTGYDLHRLAPGRSLVLAGEVIPFDLGPIAHSDGDVLCHALIDALLGAAGAGDIGRHFPNTDAAWKNAAGLELLVRALTVIQSAGWAVANVDVTIVLERPKLSPHIPAIVLRLAKILDIATDCVSVKGKTNEGVDAVGRGEAIAAHAVALLTRAEPVR